MGAIAQSMVVTRAKTRRYYRFLSEDMDLPFEKMEQIPFYRIMMLNPQGLDALWRIKKVIHPDNIKAMKYVLFEEILSNKSMEEILLAAQPYAYYEYPDSNKFPKIDEEYQKLADEMNKDISYFKTNTVPKTQTVKEAKKGFLKNLFDKIK